jgi:hypothetical protein
MCLFLSGSAGGRRRFGNSLPLAMPEFDAGRTGLVQHTQYFETGGAKSFYR